MKSSQQTSKSYRVIVKDPGTKEILMESIVKEDEMCYGQKVQDVSEMCGGCDGCLLMLFYPSAAFTMYIE